MEDKALERNLWILGKINRFTANLGKRDYFVGVQEWINDFSFKVIFYRVYDEDPEWAAKGLSTSLDEDIAMAFAPLMKLDGFKLNKGTCKILENDGKVWIVRSSVWKVHYEAFFEGGGKAIAKIWSSLRCKQQKNQ